jgi:ribulose-phosphate 3-epimerase
MIADLPRDRLLAEFSLWSADLANLEAELARIEPHADVMHVDVADGVFAPSFLFFPDLVARLASLTRRPVHVHLMVEAAIVEAQVREFVAAGADLVSVHAETGEAGLRAARLARELGAEAGVVLRLETPVEAIEPFLGEAAFVTLLGTAIGVKGQGLSELACPRLGAARAILARAGSDAVLAADGGIRESTVPQLRTAGAETVVMGSLAFAAPDLAERIRWIRGL